MKYYFTATSRIHLEHDKGDPRSRLKATDIRLETSNNLDGRKYTDRGVPTKEGAKILTMALVHGLVANIQASHTAGYRDSAEHLRFIIAELERGFAEVVDIIENDFKP